jgi:hypothetical protein
VRLIGRFIRYGSMMPRCPRAECRASGGDLACDVVAMLGHVVAQEYPSDHCLALQPLHSAVIFPCAVGSLVYNLQIEII